MSILIWLLVVPLGWSIAGVSRMDRVRESSAQIGSVLGAAFLTTGIATGTFTITAPGMISRQRLRDRQKT